MSLRKRLNRNSWLTTAIAVMIIVLAVGFILLQALSTRAPGAAATQAYFTTDDGESWFAEDIEKVPPFEHNGRQAVRAYIFKCSDGQPFAAYLERFTPKGKKLIEDARAKARAEKTAPPDPMFIMVLTRSEGEVKRPKQASEWVLATKDPAAHAQITRVQCSDGDMSRLFPVMP